MVVVAGERHDRRDAGLGRGTTAGVRLSGTWSSGPRCRQPPGRSAGSLRPMGKEEERTGRKREWP